VAASPLPDHGWPTGAAPRHAAVGVVAVRGSRADASGALDPQRRTSRGRMEGVGDETVRLAELGELTAEELAALREEANEARLRVGTDAERISGGGRNTPGAVSMDAQAVELWERVEAALPR
jgi:hypothetical protein